MIPENVTRHIIPMIFGWLQNFQGYGVRTLELPQYDRLHIGWRWVVNRWGPLQLPPGNYAVSLAAPVLASTGLVGSIAKERPFCHSRAWGVETAPD